jgi:hypothetical protein
MATFDPDFLPRPLGVIMGYTIKKIVSADLNVAIENDIDGWNDYISELVEEPWLQDISWNVVGAADGSILLEVSGFVEEDE